MKHLPQDPNQGVGEYVLGLARKHNVSLEPNALDHLALDITRAAGDRLEIDEVQRALAHLVEAGALTIQENQELLIAYLNEREAVV